jgi:D-alanine--poly(phosphoribitol) ligase subunit 2
VTNARDAQAAIHAQVVEIARRLGNDASKLKFDEEIPSSGLLDSAGLMELMMWFETAYDLNIDQDDLTIANFGTIDAMVAYLARNQSA